MFNLCNTESITFVLRSDYVGVVVAVVDDDWEKGDGVVVLNCLLLWIDKLTNNNNKVL